MEIRKQLFLDLDAVLTELRELSPSEAANGWDEPRAQNWQEVFTKLRDAIHEGQALRPDYDGVVFVRGLDMDGICDGVIFDLAARIGKAVRELCNLEGTEDG